MKGYLAFGCTLKHGALNAVCAISYASVGLLPTSDGAHDLGDTAVTDGEFIIVEQLICKLDRADKMAARVIVEDGKADILIGNVISQGEERASVNIVGGNCFPDIVKSMVAEGGIVFDTREGQTEFAELEIATTFFLRE